MVSREYDGEDRLIQFGERCDVNDLWINGSDHACK